MLNNIYNQIELTYHQHSNNYSLLIHNMILYKMICKYIVRDWIHQAKYKFLDRYFSSSIFLFDLPNRYHHYDKYEHIFD
jgi:uncharacterized protein (DUF927 family)